MRPNSSLASAIPNDHYQGQGPRLVTRGVEGRQLDATAKAPFSETRKGGKHLVKRDTEANVR
jgi:hypothetical protein